ncbi:MAG: LLM class flavin-dependent oxidoreductase [Chthoniobacterales bacterium]
MRLSEIPLSVLDLAPVLQGGTAVDSLRRSLELARYAERAGFHRYWVAEHHNMPGIASAATSVVIGYLAAGTSRIRVGAGGVMLLNHAPLIIAEQFGTLASLYPGRIDLGLGRAPGADQATMRVLRQGLDATGDDFPQQLEELRSYLREPTPGQRIRAFPGAGTEVPIYLFGSGGFSAQLAGELGLPFASAGHFSPDNLLPGLEFYRSRFRPSETLPRPYAMVCVNIFAADTDAEAESLATSQYQAHLFLARGMPVQLPPPKKSLAAVYAGPEQLPFLRGSIIGSAATVEEKLTALLEETQADELIIHSMIYDPDARQHSYEIVRDMAGIAV